MHNRLKTNRFELIITPRHDYRRKTKLLQKNAKKIQILEKFQEACVLILISLKNYKKAYIT
jgi:mitochondrial fission protein ELM1